MSTKQFKLSAAQIQPLVRDAGACFATDMITVDGHPVRFMYRDEPEHEHDSGWRFLSRLEDDEYMNEPAHHAIYDVNTIANYDPSVIPLLAAPVGSAYEKQETDGPFELVIDWDGREAD